MVKRIEIAIYVDRRAYENLRDFFGGDLDEMARYIECYANAVNALYHLPSLGRVRFDFTVVRLEIWQAQDTARVPETTDRMRLYEAFCDFQVSSQISTLD